VAGLPEDGPGYSAVRHLDRHDRGGEFEESLTITGPLTIEIFEAKEDYVLLGFRKYGFQAGAYLYNGSTDNACGENISNTTAPPLVMG